jgi:hypothetical protein
MDEIPAGSALCLTCGLRCIGSLHTVVTFAEDEVRAAAENGLSVFKEQGDGLF